MEPQTLINAALSAVSLLGGWTLKVVYDSINELRRADGDLHERINAMPETYMRRDDFGVFAVRIETTLGRIEAKLDAKADK